MTLSPSFEIQSPTATLTWREIDVELFTFIERYAINLSRWDLMLLFGQNPELRGESAGIAESIGRTSSIVQKELDNLTYLGILKVERSVDHAQYCLSDCPATRRAVIRMAQELSPP